MPQGMPKLSFITGDEDQQFEDAKQAIARVQSQPQTVQQVTGPGAIFKNLAKGSSFMGLAQGLANDAQNVKGYMDNPTQDVDTGLPPDEFNRSVFNIASTLAGGGAPTARPNTAGVFGGWLSRGADQGKLFDAQMMDMAGKLPNDIHQATGWFKGPDNKWRYEISDHAATVDPAALTMNVPAERYLNHPELYKAYPWLEDWKFSHNPTMRGEGSTSLNNRTITLKNPADIDTVLHEIQHPIQDFEQFSRGGNPSLQDPFVTKDAAESIRNIAAPELRRENELTQLYHMFLMRQPIRPRGMNEKLFTVEHPGVLDEIAAIRERLAKLYSDQRFDTYKRLAGETEARNVTARRAMTPEQRMAQPPWETQDFPYAAQKVAPQDYYGRGY